jgi:hypothetical protein
VTVNGAPPPPTDAICGGDCNIDGLATIDELIRGVTIALGNASVTSCAAFDLGGDGAVTVDELVGAVRNALDGCPAARFVERQCTVELPAGQSPEHTRCGEVIVPEDRRRPDGRTVRLAVVVFESTAPDAPADPLVFLSGGPDGPSLEFVHTFRPEAFGPLLGGRDFVFFDQREGQDGGVSGQRVDSWASPPS